MIDFTTYRLLDGSVVRELSGIYSPNGAGLSMPAPEGSETRLAVEDAVRRLVEDDDKRWMTLLKGTLVVRIGAPQPRYSVDGTASWFLEEIVDVNAYDNTPLSEDEVAYIAGLRLRETVMVGEPEVQVRRLS